jgi:hypothetical protein
MVDLLDCGYFLRDILSAIRRVRALASASERRQKTNEKADEHHYPKRADSLREASLRVKPLVFVLKLLVLEPIRIERRELLLPPQLLVHLTYHLENYNA